MKILVIDSLLGAVHIIRPEAEIILSLAKKGHQITLLTELETLYKEDFISSGVMLIDVKIKKKISLDLIALIRKTIKEQDIDLVYAFDSKGISNSIFACIGLPVKLVTYRGTTGGLYRHDLSSYLNALNPRVNGVVAVSDAVKKHVEKQVFSSKTKVKRIYKAHKLDWYTAKPIGLSLINSSKENLNIAFIGNIRKHKGMHIVFKAIGKLEKNINVKLIVAGNISESDKKKYFKLLGDNKDKVVYLGYREDVESIVASCDLLIQSSLRKEGLSKIIIESLAMGTPVIASDIDTNKELIKDGFNGRLYKAKDSNMLYEIIMHYYNNKKELDSLKKNIHKIFSNELDFEKSIDSIEEFFMSL